MGTGLDTQLGTAEETVYGTPVTPNKFYEILPGESLEHRPVIAEHSGLRPGLAGYRLGARRVQASRSAGGAFSLPVTTTAMGRWFKHMLGGTPTSAQQGGTAAYLQTFTPGDLTGKSLTIQKGIAPVTGSTQPFTFHGCKITDWEFSIEPNGALTLGLTVDAEDSEKTTALATASYGTFKVFHFAQGALTVGGSSVATVTNATWGGSNPSKTGRLFLGSAGLQSEPVVNDYRTVAGALDAEFHGVTTFYDRFYADTATALVLTFTGDLIAGAYYEKLQFTIPEVRFGGETPKASDVDLVVQNVPFEGRSDGTNPVITIAYTTTDTSI